MHEWREEHLGDVATIAIGGTPARDVDRYWARDHDDGHAWVAIADLVHRNINDTKERITDFGVRNSNVKLVSAGTLLMSFKLTIGRVGIAGTELFTNEAIAAIIPRSEVLDSEFLYYILPLAARNAITDTAIKGATLNKQKLNAIRIRFPNSVAEQRRIAVVLSTFDESIEQTEALIFKTSQVKQGLMHDLFTRGVLPNGELRPPRSEAPQLYKESPVGWIPVNWDVRSVDAMCSQIVDCPHSTPTYLSHGIPCLRTADLMPGELLLESAFRVSEVTYANRVERLVPRKGDIIYSREGERLGIAAPVGDERVCLGQRVMLLRPGAETSSSYLMWAMNTPNFYRHVLSGLGATTSPHVNVGDIRSAGLPCPPTSEQELLGPMLDTLHLRIREERAHRAKLQHLKRGLMHDLLTGRVRVPATLPDGASRV